MKTTMRNPILTLLLLASCSIITACDESAAPAPAPVDNTVGDAAIAPEQPAPADPWDHSGAPIDGTRITITPDPVDFCDTKVQSVEVEWDLAAAGATQLQLWVEDKAGKRNLWIAAKTPEGAKRSGNWAKEDMKFIALDAKRKRVINSATIVAAPCTTQ